MLRIKHLVVRVSCRPLPQAIDIHPYHSDPPPMPSPHAHTPNTCPPSIRNLLIDRLAVHGPQIDTVFAAI